MCFPGGAADPAHIDLSPPTGSQSSFLAQRDEDGRVPLLVSLHPHTSVHDVGHGVRGVLIGLQRRSVGVDPHCMTSNHRWVDAQRRHCKGELKLIHVVIHKSVAGMVSGVRMSPGSLRLRALSLSALSTVGSFSVEASPGTEFTRSRSSAIDIDCASKSNRLLADI